MMWSYFLVGAALAHEPGLSRLEVHADELVWAVSNADAATPGWLGETAVTQGGAPCALGPVTTRPSGDDGVEHVAALVCPGTGPLEVRATFLEHLPPGHRTLVTAGDDSLGWLDARNPTLAVSAAAPRTTTQVVLEYLGLGVEHILTGWDHLLFLGGLLLGVRTLKEAGLVVTGFTIAHSITLALAALQLVVLPSSLVEPAIALTVVWVGVENLLPENPWRRVLLTTVLGLVHGLGFAGLLAELGLPRGQLLPALLSFNGGVELGQFAVVLLALPLLRRLREAPRFGVKGLRYASIGVSLVGVGWFVERVL
jgi:hypothetical protein